MIKEDQARLESVEEEAEEFFEIAESNFYNSPPDYLKASMAYVIAADSGSLLAAYQLGFMYYGGLGVEQGAATGQGKPLVKPGYRTN